MSNYITASHWNQVDLAVWMARWPNFHPSEVCSPDNKSIKIYLPFMDALQMIRDDFGRPMHMTSVYRTISHNARIRGVSNSQHVLGKAGDCALARASDGPLLEELALKHGMTGIGRSPAKRFIHMDMRSGTPARWGSWK